jgi:AcrR family transcriptional regulator
MPISLSPARRRILDVAIDLFYREGIRAVGVDTIVEQSGVGKATLYRHFPTKDDLIVAYLEEQNSLYWERFEKSIAQYEGSAKAQLLAWLDSMIERWTAAGYRGCAFLNAVAEFSEPDHPVHQRAVEHKQAVREQLYQLGQQAGARHPDVLADQLLLLINGGLASVPTFGATGPVAQLKVIATALIDAQM